MSASNSGSSRPSGHNLSRNMPLPDKIRCEVGGEWKPVANFSKRQLEKFASASRSRRATPAKSGVSCRIHSGEPSKELQCKGPCGKWKKLDSFSRSARSTGKGWCYECTEWQLSAEPGLVPYATPNGTRDAGDDDLNSVAHGPAVISQGDTTGLAQAMNSINLAPMPVLSPASSSSTTAPSPNRSHVTHNMYGPNGEHVAAHKAMSVVSVTESDVQSIRGGSLPGRKGWANPNSRKIAHSRPSYLEEDDEDIEDIIEDVDDDGFDSPDEC